MNWKTCSVEAGARIGKRRDRDPWLSENHSNRQWDAKERVDDVSGDLL